MNRVRRAILLSVILAGLAGASPLLALAESPTLTQSIEAILRREVFAPALVAIDIRDLDTGQVLFEHNSTMNVKPASTMKLFTTAAILDAESIHAAHDDAVAQVLDAEGIEWRPDATSVETSARRDSSGRIRGDVYLVGRGDPNLSDRFEWRGSKNPFDQLASDLKAVGVKRIEGRLIGEDSLFPDEPIPDSWTADDLVWSYGAEVSALSAFDSTIVLRLEPGARDGEPGRLTLSPQTAYLTIVNHTTSGPVGSPQTLTLTRALGSRRVVLAGSIPREGKIWEGELAAPEPTLFAATLFTEALARQGIMVTGETTVSHDGVPADARPIASIRGPGLVEQIRVVNKESQNLHAETLLRRLGLMVFGDGSVAAGLKARAQFLQAQGIRSETNGMYDGSGLSRSDLVTARSLVDLLTVMDRHPRARALRDSLPIAGIDGTLKRRMVGTRAQGRVFAKTGSIRHVNALAGYVDALSGRRLVFSIIVNHHSRPSKEATEAMDEICALLVDLR